MSGNENFEWRSSITAVTERLREYLTRYPAVATLVERITAELALRDKHLEDWLNNNLVRRVHTDQTLGDNSIHTAMSWTDIGPQVQLSVIKASSRSRFIVEIAVNGLFADAAPPHYVDIGVRITGPDGYDVAVGVIRKTGDVNPQEMTLVGAKECAIGVPRGTYRVRLRVQVEAGAMSFTTTPGNTMSLTVTESPSP